MTKQQVSPASADDKEVGDQLASRPLDYLVSTLKGTVGIVPFGSLVAEVVGSAIPKQRIDRMVDVIKRMHSELSELHATIDKFEDRFRSPEYVDVFEEAMLQAGKALSDQRRQYLSNLLVRGLTSEQLDNARVKKLLFILNDLTDPELLWLNFAALETPDQQREFHARHQAVIDLDSERLFADQEQRDQWALRASYWQRLTSLGLTTPTRGSALGEITPLGRLLMAYIGAEELSK